MMNHSQTYPTLKMNRNSKIKKYSYKARQPVNEPLLHL